MKEAALAGRSAGTDRELQRLRGKCSWLAAGIIETDQHRWSWPPHYLPSPRHMSAGTHGGWVLKLRVQRTDLGRGMG